MTHKQPDLFGGPTINVGAFERDGLGFLLVYAKRIGNGMLAVGRRAGVAA